MFLIPYLFFAFVSVSLSVYFYKNPCIEPGHFFKQSPKVRLSAFKIRPNIEEDKLRLCLLVSGIAMGIFFFILTGNMLFVCVFALGPYFTLRYLKHKRLNDRLKLMKKSMLSAVELLWTPCDAGLNFREAVFKLSKETDNPIIQELSKCYQEIAVGKRREVAYRDLVKRTIPETESLVRAVFYNESTGEPISNFLLKEAERMYMEKRAKIQEIGDKISSRIMYIIIGLMGPAFIVLMFGPIMARLELATLLQLF